MTRAELLEQLRRIARNIGHTCVLQGRCPEFCATCEVTTIREAIEALAEDALVKGTPCP
jgi:3-hydroxyacyl-CoA dehydrogenase